MTGRPRWWAAAPLDLSAALADAGLARVDPTSARVTWLDTVYGHLARAGLALGLREDSSGARLQRCDLSGAVQAEAPVNAPQATWSLSSLPEAWQAELADPLDEVRAVHPQVVVREQVFEGNGWAVIGRWPARPGWPEAPPLPVEVRAKRRVKTLKACLPAHTGQAGPAAAFAAVGLPRAGLAPLGAGLAAGQRADSAIRALLRQQADAMDAHRPGLLMGVDPEALHEFRVAVRRTRSALSQLRAAAACTERRRFADHLRWLGQLTGPLRDLDVYLIELPGYAAALPAAQRPALAPLRDHLRRAQAQAHRAVVAALTDERAGAARRDWRAFVERPVEAHATGEAGWPIERVGRKRIQRALDRTLADGRAIRADSPDEALHELRKTCKKLRYLLEFFRGVFGADRSGPPIKALKRLQSVLGTFNDLCVHQAALEGFQAALADAGAPPETLRAIAALAQAMATEQGAVRGRFEARFAEFSGAERQRSFHALLAK